MTRCDPPPGWPRPAKPHARAQVYNNFPLEELIPYIDWNPFFQVWQLRGKYPNRGYPKIFNDETVGEEAKKLHTDATKMLNEVVSKRILTAKGVAGIFPASSVGDDIEVYAADKSGAQLGTFHTLRQQEEREDTTYLALSDFVAPKDTGLADYVGGFAVTAGLNSQDKIAEFKAAHDDYNAILLESLADRLAEAFAERMHERVRKEFWGYQPAEQLDNEALIAEKYVGIRPAPGYPACPEHTEKATLFDLMDVTKRTGIELTESMAMWPGAAVSGWYFSHPQSQYFVVGRLAQDQVADYAKRKGWTLQEAERWLAPNLGYNPED